MNAISISHEQNFARIDFIAPVTPESIYRLSDAVEQAVRYYGWQTAEIRIHSGGGESNSLRHVADKVASWTKQGVTIRTIALTECASAAALLLSLGSRGHRHASLSSRLLYHRPRVEAGAMLTREVQKLDGILTAESGAAVVRRLERLEATIKREDEHLHGIILDHVSPENADSALWFGSERNRRASILVARRAELESAANRGTVPIDAKDSARLTDATAALTDTTLSDIDSFEVLQAVFSLVLDADRAMNPLLAWSLMLIDNVDGLDLGTPTCGGAE